MTWPARLAAGLLRSYQIIVSPFLPQVCRFEPSCSEFARQVVSSYGLAQGAWLALRRVGRCHPFHPGGYDPPLSRR
ncbi:MAG: membrane protein insertion efficiency factor YidD [Candidatus Rokubacteria bacterium]|nr:membrane protein insertion efficiency factor YidD [Candidatus Rokubacteria bacterium]